MDEDPPLCPLCKIPLRRLPRDSWYNWICGKCGMKFTEPVTTTKFEAKGKEVVAKSEDEEIVK